MQKNNNKLTMSARFGEWYKEATENCAERELYATSLIARIDWLVDPKSGNNSRYELTTDLNKIIAALGMMLPLKFVTNEKKELYEQS